MEKKKNLNNTNTEKASNITTILHDNGILDSGPFYHGAKADLKPGDMLIPGYKSNYGEQKKANYIYLTATLDAAIWGAELAVGDRQGRRLQSAN